MSVVKWWVDDFYVVHEDCQGHTGTIISLDKVAVSSLSKKQRINGNISREGEMIDVEKSMAKILWSRYFIESKGYKFAHNKLMEDNKSAILLENNGKFSSSKRNKHINTRYLFVMYRLAQVHLEIEHCHSERIWDNIMSKPLQERAFKEFRVQSGTNKLPS